MPNWQRDCGESPTLKLSSGLGALARIEASLGSGGVASAHGSSNRRGTGAVKTQELALAGVCVVEPTVHGDDRGFFFEAWNAGAFDEAFGPTSFVQDNHSMSAAGVLRGMHYQEPFPQGKLVRVASGAVFDVALDIDPASGTFGSWVGVELSASNKKQLWIPPGYAHGFLALEDHTEVLYKTTEFYMPEHDHSIRWDDAEAGIAWPQLDVEYVVSSKDAAAPGLRAARIANEGGHCA